MAVTPFARENKIVFAWQTRFHDRMVCGRNELKLIAEYMATMSLIGNKTK